MKVLTLTALIAVFLTACGGGGGDGSDYSGVGESATITGAVTGTEVVAFDENDNEIDSDIATGSPKTFTLTVPIGGGYRFYLIENEGTANQRVYPLYQGTANVFNISSTVTIDLGFVDTSTGVAVPTNNPLDVSGVSSGGENTSIPSSLSGSVFTTSDLQGTWNIHLLTSGDDPQWIGWAYGTTNIDSSGNVTWASITRSDGNSSLPSSDTLSITSSGIVSGAGSASFQGVMSQDKSMIVATLDDGGGGYDLIIYQKSGGSFTTSDLQGTWNIHLLTSGDDPQWIGWAYGTTNIDSSGNVTWASITRSDGNSSLPSSDTLSITSSGIVSGAGSASFQGVMSQDKSMIVATLDDGGGGYDLIIYQK